MLDIFSHLDTSLLNQGYLKPMLALLLSCLLILPVLERLRISPVLGYLLAGLLIGPSGLDIIGHNSNLETLADFGVVFLLFIIGLNLSWSHLATIRHYVVRIGLAQVALSGAVIAAIAWQWEHSPAVTILLGFVFALSSTAIVSQHLLDTKGLHSEKGKLSMAILLAQDFAVVPLLVMVKVLSENTQDDLSRVFFITFIKAIVAVILVTVLGRYVFRPAYRYLHAQTRTPEITVALSLLAVLTAATVTSMGGLSMELGAFLAGLILAGSQFQDKIQKDIRPFQGLLLGLFFITVGMQIDISAVLNSFGWLLLSVIGLTVIKVSVIIALGLINKTPLSTALPTALLLGQGSEFAFVIIGTAMHAGLMPTAIAQFMLLVTALSMLMTPLYILLSDRAERYYTSG